MAGCGIFRCRLLEADTMALIPKTCSAKDGRYNAERKNLTGSRLV